MAMHSDFDLAKFLRARDPEPTPQFQVATDGRSPQGDDAASGGGPLGPMLKVHPLTARQQQAMIHMLAGMSMSKAAEAAGVARSTLQHWTRHDEHFRAEWQVRMDQMWAATEGQLNACATAAVELVLARLHAGDVATALRVFEVFKASPVDRAQVECPGSDR